MTNIQLQEDQSNWSIFIDRIPFTIIRDEMSNSFFAYTDNLECAGRGETLEEAAASLHTYIVYFILYNISINNIDILNKNLGWNIEHENKDRITITANGLKITAHKKNPIKMREITDDGKIIEDIVTNPEVIAAIKNYEQTKKTVQIDLQKLLELSQAGKTSKKELIKAIRKEKYATC
jgi:hypothetical protein